MGFSEVAGKFRSLAGPVIAEDRVDDLIETVERLELLDDIRELTCLLA